MNSKISVSKIFQINQTIQKIVVLFAQKEKCDKKHDIHIKSLSELSNICDGYNDLYQELKSKTNKSEIENIAEYILYTNIKVHFINIQFAHITSKGHFTRLIKKIDENYHNGRFTEEEDEIICKNWIDLCQSCMINQPEMLMEQIHKKNYFQDHKYIQNVIGCYLGVNLKRVRHASDIFSRSKISWLLSKSKRKKFSSDDDQIILNEVSKNGCTSTTWETIAKKLNIDEIYSKSIRNRYNYMKTSSFNTAGNWSLEEDTAMLEELFRNKKCGTNTVKSINSKSFVAVKEVKRSKQLMSERYRRYLQPILMNHHLGTLNFNWKYNFFVHILNKNYKASKEIVWEDALSLWPGQTLNSLLRTLNDAIRSTRKHNKNMNFRDAIKEHIAKISNTDDFTEKQKAYRRKIVDTYLKCTVP